MSSLQDNAPQYVINCEIKKKQYKGEINSFNAWETESFIIYPRGDHYFKSKNEAIDVMIKRLKEMKE